METRLFAKKRLRVCYWNTDSRVVDRDLMLLESHLQKLAQIDLVAVQSLADSNLMPCDLIIIAATLIGEDEFPQWLSGLKKKVGVQGLIWTPALILSEIDFNKIEGILRQIAQENWYFDIISPDHVRSLPIRVANLLRIHDHLHELKRYNELVSQMAARIDEFETLLEKMQGPDEPK